MCEIKDNFKQSGFLREILYDKDTSGSISLNSSLNMDQFMLSFA